MGEIRTYRDLVAWQEGIALARDVYQLTLSLPAQERYGLSSQMQRCAISIPSNIAEGWAYGTTPVFLRRLRTSRGSIAELETQLVLVRELHAIEPSHALLDRCDRTARLVQGLIHSLETKLRNEERHP